MTTIEDGGPAFPTSIFATDGGLGFEGEPLKPGKTTYYCGISMRDHFAAAAMPALLADYCESAQKVGFDEQWQMGVAMDAYAMADAMLAAREANPQA